PPRANQPRPAATPTTPAQQPAARPATPPPAQQPAARPATPAPAPAQAARPMMMGADRSQSWEITIQGGLFSVDKAAGSRVVAAGISPSQFLIGGSAGIAKQVSEHIG